MVLYNSSVDGGKRKRRWFSFYSRVLLPIVACGASVLGFITVYSLFSGKYESLQVYFSTLYDRRSFYMAVILQGVLYLVTLVGAILLATRFYKQDKSIRYINTAFLWVTAAALSLEIAVSCWLLVSPLLVFLTALVILGAVWVLPNMVYFSKCYAAAQSPMSAPRITVTDTGMPVDLSAEETPPPDKAVDCVCAHCGCELVSDASFCHECGWKITADHSTCGRCGAELPEGANFCRICGEKVT